MASKAMSVSSRSARIFRSARREIRARLRWTRSSRASNRASATTPPRRKRPHCRTLPSVDLADPRHGEIDLEREVKRWHQALVGQRAAIYDDLARLPFRLIVSSAHDPLMETAFAHAERPASVDWYNYRGGRRAAAEHTDARDAGAVSPARPCGGFLLARAHRDAAARLSGRSHRESAAAARTTSPDCWPRDDCSCFSASVCASGILKNSPARAEGPEGRQPHVRVRDVDGRLQSSTRRHRPFLSRELSLRHSSPRRRRVRQRTAPPLRRHAIDRTSADDSGSVGKRRPAADGFRMPCERGRRESARGRPARGSGRRAAVGRPKLVARR